MVAFSSLLAAALMAAVAAFDIGPFSFDGFSVSINDTADDEGQGLLYPPSIFAARVFGRAPQDHGGHWPDDPRSPAPPKPAPSSAKPEPAPSAPSGAASPTGAGGHTKGGGTSAGPAPTRAQDPKGTSAASPGKSSANSGGVAGLGVAVAAFLGAGNA